MSAYDEHDYVGSVVRIWCEHCCRYTMRVVTAVEGEPGLESYTTTACAEHPRIETIVPRGDLL